MRIFYDKPIFTSNEKMVNSDFIVLGGIMMKLLKKAITLMIVLIMITESFPKQGVQAASKPAKPVISASIEKDVNVKITINTTEGAQGYTIMMKAPEKTKFSKVKTLKKDGTAKRSFTIKYLSEGTYSFKVKAYTKKSGKTAWSSYSKTVSITIEGTSKQEDHTTSFSTSDFSNAKNGDIIVFGSYEQDNNLENGSEPIEWIVLSNDKDELFVVSKYALDCKKYNEEYIEVTWETSTLRKWLNEDFYKTAFSKAEQSIIKTTTLKNEDNPEFGTLYGAKGGNDTEDKVFLLSIADMINTDYGFINEYYDLNEDNMINRRCAPTAYVIGQSIWTISRYKTAEGYEACLWWLRSPGSEKLKAAYVNNDGTIDYGGYYFYDHKMTIRPALVINLNL